MKKIEGLDNLTKLKKLFLVNNKIGKIENINHLVELEMLELGANRIRVSILCFINAFYQSTLIKHESCLFVQGVTIP